MEGDEPEEQERGDEGDSSKRAERRGAYRRVDDLGCKERGKEGGWSRISMSVVGSQLELRVKRDHCYPHSHTTRLCPPRLEREERVVERDEQRAEPPHPRLRQAHRGRY